MIKYILSVLLLAASFTAKPDVNSEDRLLDWLAMDDHYGPNGNLPFTGEIETWDTLLGLMVSKDKKLDQYQTARAVALAGKTPKDHSAFKPLKKLAIGYAASPERELRIAAVNALGEYGDPQDIGVLVVLMHDEDMTVRSRAVYCFGDLASSETAPVLDAWYAWVLRGNGLSEDGSISPEERDSYLNAQKKITTIKR